jgi:sugar phosphate permease
LATLAVLFFGYACCYFHRADLSTLAPLWAARPSAAPLAQALPDIASLGMLVYAFG